MLTGRCHCGAVTVEVPSVPAAMTLCNCSICRRYGMLTAYFPQAAVRIDGHPGHTDTYVWGDRSLQFVRCRHCGCVLGWEPLKPNGDGRMGVNMRNFDPAALQDTRLRRFDGADTWKYIDEPATPPAATR
jgi:hypothetical protein